MPFTIPLSIEVMNSLRLRKVKILNLELYNGTTNPEEKLVVQKGIKQGTVLERAGPQRKYTLQGLREAMK